MKDSHNVAVSESYKDWQPPVAVGVAVNRLLNGIPQQYLIGLKSLFLTNSSNLPHDFRKGKTKSRGRKVTMVDCLGYYQEKQKSRPAQIVLLMDNMLDSTPNFFLRIPLILDAVISHTLYHELGHHIHKTQAPQYAEKEDVADEWLRKLRRHYFRKHYWYMTPVFALLWLLLKPLKWIARKK